MWSNLAVQSMNENSLLLSMRSAVSRSSAFSEVLKLLPPPHLLALRLDDRLSCRLVLENEQATLNANADEGLAPHADLELILFSESIRRLSSRSYDTIPSLLKEFTSLAVQGHVRRKPLCSIMELKQKGYLLTVQRLGAAPAHLAIEMLSHRFSFFKPFVVTPSELFLKKLRDIVQK